MSDLTIIAGPCIIESESFVIDVAQELKEKLSPHGVDFYFKASFDKANRSSGKSFRGPGLGKGLEILSKVKKEVGVKILTDFHLPEQASSVAEVADVIQIPAFLCRQTDMIEEGVRACAGNDRILNIKKGQFMAPWDMRNVSEKIISIASEQGVSCPEYWITERGFTHGYNRYVVDMMGLSVMENYCSRVVYDATHSVQLPGAGVDGKISAGERNSIPYLARAAVAAGARGIFLECHPNPSKAKSDPATSIPISDVEKFVSELVVLRQTVQKFSQFNWS